MGETALEVNHVSIDYKNLMHMSMHQALLKKDVKRADIVRAVDDVSFSVEKGKILGIVGRNGSGKTTLLRILGGFLKQNEGQVIFDDVDLLLESSDQMKDGLIQRETVFL